MYKKRGNLKPSHILLQSLPFNPLLHQFNRILKGIGSSMIGVGEGHQRSGSGRDKGQSRVHTAPSTNKNWLVSQHKQNNKGSYPVKSKQLSCSSESTYSSSKLSN